MGRGTKEAKKLLCKEGFTLAAKTGYGRTVSNVQGRGIPNDGSSYRKLRDPKTVRTRGRTINLNQKSVKYEKGHNGQRSR